MPNISIFFCDIFIQLIERLRNWRRAIFYSSLGTDSQKNRIWSNRESHDVYVSYISQYNHLSHNIFVFIAISAIVVEEYLFVCVGQSS